MGDQRGTRVYVGNLTDKIKKDDLEGEFTKYGKLNSVWIAFNPPGFAFVEFEHRDDAEKACDVLNGSELLGSQLRVEISKGRPRQGRRGGGDRGGRGRRDYNDNRRREYSDYNRGGRRDNYSAGSGSGGRYGGERGYSGNRSGGGGYGGGGGDRYGGGGRQGGRDGNRSFGSGGGGGGARYRSRSPGHHRF